MATFTILYNNCYGGFAFSDAFLEEYKKRTGKVLDTFKALFRLGAESIRCNPVAVAIFKEKGSEWCSGLDSQIEAFECPVALAKYWEIDEYDGDEHVRVLIAEALADILHTFMNTEDRVVLERQYAVIMGKDGAKSKETSSPKNLNLVSYWGC